MKTLYCMGKICENVAIVLQKRYILIVAILQVGNLISDVKNVTYSMIQSSNKKRFKKDIHILKIQEIVNIVNNMETQTVSTVTFLAQYAKINFTIKKRRISCHYLFLLNNRGPARYLTPQEDHNVSICGLFLF